MKQIIFVFIVLILTGCSSNNKIDIEKIMKENEYIIIDVRTKEEYDNLHVVDAINIPYDQIQNQEFDKEKVIFVYCQSGNRSGKAYDILNNMGYQVYDLGSVSSIDLPKE